MRHSKSLLLQLIAISLPAFCASDPRTDCEGELASAVSGIMASDSRDALAKHQTELDTLLTECRVPATLHIPLLGDFPSWEVRILANNVDEINHILDKHPRQYVTPTYALTPVHIAAAYADVGVLTKLIELGFDVNAKDSIGNTPLMSMVGGPPFRGENADVLISAGAEIDARNADDLTALELAVVSSDRAAARFFVDHLDRSIPEHRANLERARRMVKQMGLPESFLDES